MSRLDSYAVATPGLHARLDAGAAPGHLHRIDATARSSALLVEAARRFSERAHADYDMPTPRWAFYDCAVMPGLVFGLAEAGARLEPVSVFVALPTLEADHWFVYQVAGERCAETLAAGVALVGATAITATAPWRSPELAAHAGHAPLELLAAHIAGTAVVRYRPGGGEAVAATGAVDAGDPAALAALQSEIEAGARVAITGAPVGDAVPIAVLR